MKKQVNEFPITKTKTRGVKKEFNLNTPGGRREYFNQKAGKEIALLKNYFKKLNCQIIHIAKTKTHLKTTRYLIIVRTPSPNRKNPSTKTA